MKCPVCDSDEVYCMGQSSTLVGYYSPPGHNHDDNCIIEEYECAGGHQFTVRNQNICPVCDWKGKTDCFCHPLGVRIQTEKVTRRPTLTRKNSSKWKF